MKTREVVTTIGFEADPVKRLRYRWAAEMRATRLMLGWTLQDVADALAEEDEHFRVTAAAVSAWERGVNTPRPHLQIAFCKVVRRQHRDVFPMTNEAA